MSKVIGDFTIANTSRLQSNIKQALDESAKGVQADFDRTTSTWQRDVTFEIVNTAEYARIIGTDDEIYGYVNDGTKPHIIRPKTAKALVFGVGGSAKTRPRTIGSTSGSKGNTIVAAKVVHHPGSDARQFDEVIEDKWQKQLEQHIDRIMEAV